MCLCLRPPQGPGRNHPCGPAPAYGDVGGKTGHGRNILAWQERWLDPGRAGFRSSHGVEDVLLRERRRRGSGRDRRSCLVDLSGLAQTLTRFRTACASHFWPGWPPRVLVWCFLSLASTPASAGIVACGWRPQPWRLAGCPSQCDHCALAQRARALACVSARIRR